ncbi:AAA family ATPase [Photobacterium damselae]|uniref:AAA family ATPase n=1 Tax=Photobacterium damselae TaxID=38293 RepID=UPI001247A94E|nr:ATP-binding protein [Photobacterium damselae]KAB1179587.1 ATP-binding protein [Photobacterium damselae subsp. damselae]MBF7098086.1 ATP-binding protein [Photobacterium damselae]
MKLTSVNLNGTEYKLSVGHENNSNTFTIIIGKNGTGKSRLLTKVASTLLKCKRYNQNHTKLKQSKVQEMTFMNRDKFISVNSGKGKSGRLFERNRHTKDNMCRKLIAASISPFDKFPLPENNSSLSVRDNFYSYIGFKTDKASLSDKNLLTRFATSIISSRSNVAVKRTLRLLGYKSDINIRFKHNSERYFRNENHLSKKMTFREVVLNNKELYSRVLHDNNYLMSNLILQELSQTNKTVIGKKTIHDLIGDNNLPDSYSTNSKLDDKTTSDLIRSLELNISDISNIVLRKNDSNGNLTLNDASSGERSMLLLVCSIASQITNDSIVLIDEPEISLHPAWQETFVDLISKAFAHYKRCHFIIATHSPLIVSNLPEMDCFIVNMDINKTVSSKNYHNKSADYQLATLFNTPGFQNEYLNRVCIAILSDFANGCPITDSQIDNINFLISIHDTLDDIDNVKVLIGIIKKTWEVVKPC